ncbi:P-loop containing nucleoside triphosphate hydrolase protein [Trichoderma citrinoviride]|uniref:Kinesin-like protein n=1 Tax=Trichoderma citrinoviride TaxID=58853 RepID=A0A2T4BEF7_9HYPO|nr:P-loop containing nucleoside triphosphate hydrolase protein [Trichoderma citrinoviride]PTB67695.1 P-loop containing nucleoside triphosphate hydrolase protein [Trichoderma citrinoviride]
MEPGSITQKLFEVYLRLRPPYPGAPQTEPILHVEDPHDNLHPSHITLNPPADRRRAIERFGFTQVFEEDASQLDVFHCTDTSSLIEGVLAPQGGDGTDAVVATLGVTGSGKTHTILGSRNQRGLAQLAIDVIFRSIIDNMVESAQSPTLDSLQACDASEATLVTAPYFLDTMNSDQGPTYRGSGSRSTTPMMVRNKSTLSPSKTNTPSKMRPKLQQMPGSFPDSDVASPKSHSPDVSDFIVPCDPAAEYVVVVSMYEVHNDRIYDLLTPASKSPASKDYRRRPLLYKPTELSPDRKVVAGLRKVVCTDAREALLVLEAGLQERRVAGTGSNSVSSRSHGFFCFEVKKRAFGWKNNSWSGSKLTVVDLAGSERARDAKTQGATLVEAGKINESLMYLGQCLQSQSEISSGKQPNVVPYRQCKLTEILFSNSFPSAAGGYNHIPRRNPQRGIMIVTADPLGDFNATSQILRYSALARDVTVPRAPSFSVNMLAPSPTHSTQHTRPFGNTGFGSTRSHFSPANATEERVTMEIAALEIARMSDEIEQLRDEIEVQSEARIAAEAHLLSTEDRMIDMEAAVREECAIEFEQRLAIELARFKASMQIEKERHEEHWDRKVDILERGLDTGFMEEDFDKENVLVENLTQEVERLRRENAILKRELANRSPSKRKPLEEREDFPSGSSSKHDNLTVSTLGRKLERIKISDGSKPGSPKKIRRLVARRWEESDEA